MDLKKRTYAADQRIILWRERKLWSTLIALLIGMPIAFLLAKQGEVFYLPAAGIAAFSMGLLASTYWPTKQVRESLKVMADLNKHYYTGMTSWEWAHAQKVYYEDGEPIWANEQEYWADRRRTEENYKEIEARTNVKLEPKFGMQPQDVREMFEWQKSKEAENA